MKEVLPWRRSWTILLTLVIPFAPSSLPETQPQPESSKTPISSHEDETWTVDLNSLGGFHGKGGGGAHITSQGIVFAGRFNVMSPHHVPCRSQLSEKDLQKIAEAVSSANASTWKSSYVPDGDNGCCDRFRWMLLLYQRASDGTGHTYGTHWYEGNETLLPHDLVTLQAAILTIKSTVLKVCEQ